MAIDSKHPLYTEFSPDWIMMRDLAAGERHVKSKRTIYLPATQSMIIDGLGKGIDKVGEQVYCGYLNRAVFPDHVKDGIDTLLGMLNYKQATFELPAKMESLRKSCTLNGDSLDDLLRRIHAEQLTTGRVGLLADLPENKNVMGLTASPNNSTVLPYISLYDAEALINWDDSGDTLKYSALNLVVLNESSLKRNVDFNWTNFQRYRVLTLGAAATNEPEGTPSVYKVGVFDEKRGLSFDDSAMIVPTYLGKPLNEIPFVIINTRDLVGYPDQPPLLGLGRLVLAIYRGEADYRNGLFMTGQDTLVVIGASGQKKEGVPGQSDATRIGAGAKIEVDQGGDAKFIGVNSNGLSEQRQCLEADYKKAEHKSGQLLIAGKSGDQESGAALKTRLGAQTANLMQIAMTSGKGLETMLRTIAKWIGEDPEKVKVIPNMEFGDLGLEAADFTDLTAAREAGAPISKRSLHQLLRIRRFTSLSYEEEVAAINKEKTELPDPAVEAAEKAAKDALAQAKLSSKNKDSGGNVPA